MTSERFQVKKKDVYVSIIALILVGLLAFSLHQEGGKSYYDSAVHDDCEKQYVNYCRDKGEICYRMSYDEVGRMIYNCVYYGERIK